MAQKVPLIWSPSRKTRPFSSSGVSISLPPLSNSPASVAKGGGTCDYPFPPSSRLNECPLSRRHRSRGEGGAVGRNLPQSHLSPPQNTSVPPQLCLLVQNPFSLSLTQQPQPWLTYCKSPQKERRRLGAAPEVAGSEQRLGAQEKKGRHRQWATKVAPGPSFWRNKAPPPPSLPPSITNARSDRRREKRKKEKRRNRSRGRERTFFWSDIVDGLGWFSYLAMGLGQLCVAVGIPRSITNTFC